MTKPLEPRDTCVKCKKASWIIYLSREYTKLCPVCAGKSKA